MRWRQQTDRCLNYFVNTAYCIFKARKKNEKNGVGMLPLMVFKILLLRIRSSECRLKKKLNSMIYIYWSIYLWCKIFIDVKRLIRCTNFCTDASGVQGDVMLSLLMSARAPPFFCSWSNFAADELVV